MAEWIILFACPPNQPQEAGGILLLDRSSNRLLVKLKAKLTLADSHVQEVWEDLAADLEDRAEVDGGDQVMTWLETGWSHVFQVSDRQVVDSENLDATIRELYGRNINPV